MLTHSKSYSLHFSAELDEKYVASSTLQCLVQADAAKVAAEPRAADDTPSDFSMGKAPQLRDSREASSDSAKGDGVSIDVAGAPQSTEEAVPSGGGAAPRSDGDATGKRNHEVRDCCVSSETEGTL